MSESGKADQSQGDDAPTSTTEIHMTEIATVRANLEVHIEKARRGLKRSMVETLGFFITTIAAIFATSSTALTFVHIPSKSSHINYTIIGIIVAGFIGFAVAGLSGIALYRRLNARRRHHLEDKLSGSDLRAISAFARRELELLSTLSQGGQR